MSGEHPLKLVFILNRLNVKGLLLVIIESCLVSVMMPVPVVITMIVVAAVAVSTIVGLASSAVAGSASAESVPTLVVVM